MLNEVAAKEKSDSNLKSLPASVNFQLIAERLLGEVNIASKFITEKFPTTWIFRNQW